MMLGGAVMRGEKAKDALAFDELLSSRLRGIVRHVPRKDLAVWSVAVCNR